VISKTHLFILQIVLEGRRKYSGLSQSALSDDDVSILHRPKSSAGTSELDCRASE
jgi:hypothetical protein